MKNHHLQGLIFGVRGWHLRYSQKDDWLFYAVLKSLIINPEQCLSNFTRLSWLLWFQFRQNIDDMEQDGYLSIIFSIFWFPQNEKTLSTALEKMLITLWLLFLLWVIYFSNHECFLFDFVLPTASLHFPTPKYTANIPNICFRLFSRLPTYLDAPS